MRVLLSVIDETTGSASAGEMVAIDAFNERLRAEGRLVLACGLEPLGEARVVDARDSQEPVVHDGPLHETKEHVTGFWVLDLGEIADDALLGLVGEASAACGRKIEVRRLA